MEDLAGKIAFVTGAASGIGLGIAEALVAHGARVVLSDWDADEVGRQAQRLGPCAQGLALDVTDRAGWAAAQQFTDDWAGAPVDILVNSAGVGPAMTPLVDMTPENFDQLVRVKIDGTFNGIHTFAAGMRERRCGHVVNTASMSGLFTMPHLGEYTTAMFGIVGMTEVLHAELAASGVGASVLCPGLVRTRLTANTRALRGEPAQEQERSETVAPTNLTHTRVLEPRVVGDMVVDAIRAGDLYIVTHGEFRDVVEKRVRLLLDAFARAPLPE